MDSQPRVADLWSTGCSALLSINILGPRTPRARFTSAPKRRPALDRPKSSGDFFSLWVPFFSFQAPTSRSQAPNSGNLGYVDDWILSTPWLEPHFWSSRSQNSSFPHGCLIIFSRDFRSILPLLIIIYL